MKFSVAFAYLFTVSALVGCAAGAGEKNGFASPGQTNKTASTVDDEKDTMDCKLYQVTGSRVGRKVCMTNREREKLSEKSSEILRSQVRKGGLGSSRQGPG
ncbi:hypothetical protein [Microbulbifer taiwanensis]|uniref:Lipoprotein n=1 Tax=Microbulbifer taiwanensis TaxID=986746 RepID=A0ABW1YS02_9GAMM|nr:hypothetical protein [Microbulbifer taiwanensis]